ncbi:SAM-dependent methyltransferase [Nocardioides sp. OK12]|uniref:class I SAM-dependent methyltransferase n=1 Tax=Nocardioides sp. OK12 TaxID=2758661 RepID=UPI0021C3BA7E|nr:class I SAM-dependent methyltransferase [Nocardioides sp. OK12]GHJ58850.1 SAM-dependent methyltransferase [Nocardioides sp. OK12]
MAAFDVSAETYDRFMGRFSRPLAPVFCDAVLPGGRVPASVLDVGCGPGALVEQLSRRRTAAGADVRRLAAVDPAPTFVAAVSDRHPDVETLQAGAEELPFVDDEFEATLAQLVVHFMDDPAAGVAEMVRVTRPGGLVAACVWDHGGGRGPLSPFWSAVESLAPGTAAAPSTGSSGGDLERLWRAAGLAAVREERIGVRVDFTGFEQWWAPFEQAAGSVRAYLDRLEPSEVARLRDLLRTRLGEGPFAVEAEAWCVSGQVPG